MKPRRKILLLVRPMRGGMRHHLLSLARLLPRDEFAIEAAGPPDDPLLRELVEMDIPVSPLNISAALNPWHDLKATQQLRRILTRGDYALVHAHGFKASVPGRLAGILAGGVPVVYTVHNFVAPMSKQRLYRQAYLTAERFLAPATSRYIAVSQALADSISKDVGVAPDRIKVIHNGIDLRLFPDGDTTAISRPQPFILCVARLVWEKGLHILIAAVAKLKAAGMSPRLVIVGDGPLRGELERLANSMGLSAEVQLLGFREDVLDLYRQAAVVAFPSLAEGLSISLLEAMASARPVVITQTGGMVELVESGVSGLIVPPGEPDALADALSRILADESLATGFGRAARQVAKEHAAEAMAQKTGDVYREVLDRKKVYRP